MLHYINKMMRLFSLQTTVKHYILAAS